MPVVLEPAFILAALAFPSPNEFKRDARANGDLRDASAAPAPVFFEARRDIGGDA